MEKSSIAEKNEGKEIGNQVEMIHFHMEFLCLSNSESLMPFISIAKSIFANQDDDVWMEIHSYRDRKHADKVQAKLKMMKI